MTMPPIPKGQKIDRKIQVYRDIDNIYSEHGLVSIMFLSCGRHDVTKFCIESTLNSLRNFNGNIEFIFMEQGWNVNYQEAEKNLIFYKSLKYDRSVIIIPNKNYGINNAINQMYRLSRGIYTLLLECDWYCLSNDSYWLDNGCKILDNYENIGVVQLRNIYDPNENWGYGKQQYNPFSICNNKNILRQYTSDNIPFLLATHKFAGINNNPNLVRKDVYRDIGLCKEPLLESNLKHGETDREERFMNTTWKVAHLIDGVFFHKRLL